MLHGILQKRFKTRVPCYPPLQYSSEYPGSWLTNPQTFAKRKDLQQTMMNSSNSIPSKPQTSSVAVGNVGYFSEFLLQSNSKTYIKERFSPNKTKYNEIDKARATVFEMEKPKPTTIILAPMVPHVREQTIQPQPRTIRTHITIAELLNPMD